MSGGFFDYSQYDISQIADDIEQLIRNNKKVDEWGNSRNYSDETLRKFEETLTLLRKAAIMTHRIDYLVSGDDCEDTFHTRLDEDLHNP
jgi:hypothetical protein